MKIEEKIYQNGEKIALTRCPNKMVLDVSPWWRGDGPIVITNEVLAVPAY